MSNQFKNWNLIRGIRLVSGLGLAIYAFSSGEMMLLLIAGVFLFQAFFNVSCCGTSGCSIADKQTQQKEE